MTVREFENLKAKLETAKTNKARAEGALGKIQEQIKNTYGIGVEEISSKVNEFNEAIAKLSQRKDKLIAKLDKLCDWEAV